MTMVEDERSIAVGMKRGVRRLCPNCGEAPLFAGYLKVQSDCGTCGHANGLYRADDGPAYFTILLVGHLVVAPLLFFRFVWASPPLVVAGIILPLLAAVTLAALPVVKGGMIGFMWSKRIVGVG
jgi:uncharacterized protein (DUF983 family)